MGRGKSSSGKLAANHFEVIKDGAYYVPSKHIKVITDVVKNDVITEIQNMLTLTPEQKRLTDLMKVPVPQEVQKAVDMRRKRSDELIAARRGSVQQ